jgi:hypothetical protein
MNFSVDLRYGDAPARTRITEPQSVILR